MRSVLLAAALAASFLPAIARADGAAAPAPSADGVAALTDPVSPDHASEKPAGPRGVVVQLRSSFSAPMGGAVPLPMGSLDRVVRTELVPLRLDLGYRLDHFYVGVFAQKSHGQTENARLTSPTAQPASVTSTDFELGATAEYHLPAITIIEPWFGIYVARRSMWITSSDAQGLRLKGPEGGLTLGADAPIVGGLTIGLYSSLGYSILSLSSIDDSQPVAGHAGVSWLSGGLRVSWLL